MLTQSVELFLVGLVLGLGTGGLVLLCPAAVRRFARPGTAPRLHLAASLAAVAAGLLSLIAASHSPDHGHAQGFAHGFWQGFGLSGFGFGLAYLGEAIRWIRGGSRGIASKRGNRGPQAAENERQ